jgi:hypothetical protein
VQIGFHNEGRCFLTGGLFEELAPERPWIPDAVARNGAMLICCYRLCGDAGVCFLSIA